MAKQDITGLEHSLGYFFKNKALLSEATTHKSFLHENPEKAPLSNERLEFLGDSVLGLVVVEYLFGLQRNYSESTMSKIKSYLVKESVLSDIAERISIGSHLKLGRGEEETGGRNKRSILADAIEAVFGAIYLDAGYDTARSVVLRHLRDIVDEAISSEQLFDYKTKLQEESQLKFSVLPEYKVVKQEGAEHKKTFTVDVFINSRKMGRGKGRSKKEAETLAAKEALVGLRK